MEKNITPTLARLTALRYFFDVVQYGSFRRAAEETHVAASAINRQIKNLEEALAVRLFDRERGRGGLRLTEAGKILHYRLCSVMNELSIAGDEINELKGMQRGHLKVGVNEVLASDLLPSIVAELHGRYPNITFTVTVDNTPEIVKLLRKGDVDIGLGYNFPTLEELHVIDAFRRKTYLITSIDHPLSNKQSIGLRDIMGADFILPDRSLALRRMLDEAFAATNLIVNPIIETNSFTLLRTMVQKGLGVSIVTGSFLIHSPEKLAFVNIRESVIKSGVLSCCTISGRTPPAAALAFSEAVKALFQRFSP
jgi:DNA-binding transcriptional LysR family regulator